MRTAGGACRAIRCASWTARIPDLQQLIAAAPLLTDYLDAESQAHFATLRATLAAMGVDYTVNPRLVRGLDYYSRTVFEWTTDALGAQDAVCSGGRYDGLITQLGGEATPAIGFAMGVERVVELLRQLPSQPQPPAADVYVVLNGERRRGGRRPDRRVVARCAAASTLRDEPGRGQFQGPVPPGRSQPGAPWH